MAYTLYVRFRPPLSNVVVTKVVVGGIAANGDGGGGVFYYDESSSATGRAHPLTRNSVFLEFI